MAQRPIPKLPMTQLHQFLHRSLASPFESSTSSPPHFNNHSFAEAIINAINEPIIILDTTFTIIALNKTFLRTFKLSKKQLIKQNLLTFTDASPALKPLLKKLEILKRTKTIIDPFEFTYDFAKIGTRTLLIKGKHISLGKYRTDFILLALQDITQRKILEQQKDDFIGYVTHELKTPITAASAFMQILESYHQKTQDTKSLFLLRKANAQMDRLTHLLNSFTKVYKAQTGTLRTANIPLSLNKLVSDLVESFSYTQSTHHIEIQGKITHQVLGDPEKIQEVITNLLTNAMKYSANAKKVTIILEENPDRAIVRVRDYGLGLSKEEQEKVFERFYRVKGKRDNKIEGLGLGLYLTAAIIKEHKGEIWVESEVNKGSTFSFSLPLQKK